MVRFLGINDSLEACVRPSEYRLSAVCGQGCEPTDELFIVQMMVKL